MNNCELISDDFHRQKYLSEIKCSSRFLCPKYYNLYNKKAMLSQGEPRDATVNFHTYRILQ